jgi:hypothetical protein
MYIYSVKGGGGYGVLLEHLLQEFNTLYLIRFKIYNIATPPQTNTAKFLYMSIFLDDDILLWCLYSQWAVLYTEEASFTVTHTQYYLQYMVDDGHLLVMLMDLMMVSYV